MPLGLLCSSGSKNDEDGRVCRTHIELLDNTVLHLDLAKDTTGAGSLDIVGEKIGLTEITYFGLQYVNKKGSEWWLELDKPVSKQLQRHGAGYMDVSLKLQVHFFVSDVYSLQEQFTRHLYYLQLKSNVLQSRLSCTEEAAIILASYIVQAELGDYVDDHSFSNIRNFDLLPENLMLSHSRDEVYLQIFDLYKSHSGLSKVDAEMEFVKLTQQLEGYGDEYYPAKDKQGILILIGATFRGIIIRHSHGLPPVCFKWPDIIRITYSKRYFCIETTKTLDTIQFLMEDNATAKYVWKMFVGHHRFRRLNVTQTPHEFEKHRWSKKIHSERKITLNGATSPDDFVATSDPISVASPENSESVSDEQIHVSQIENVASTPGIINPLFEDETGSTDNIKYDDTLNLKEEEEVVLRNSPDIKNKTARPVSSILPDVTQKSVPGTLDRPKSMDLSEIPGTSINRHSKSTGKLSNHGVGSSLSVDSGHPPPYNSSEFFNHGLSLDSLVEGGNTGNMMQERSPKQAQRAASSIGFVENHNTEKPSRPTSLNIEGIGSDHWTAVRTSGYASCTDSDFSEDNWRDDDEQLSRHSQLHELERTLSEGQIFTEYQKTKRRSENLSVSTGSLPMNEMRNRFDDILPYEDNRVQLSPRSNPLNNSYINASHIRIKIGRRLYKYIAAQGPTNDTLHDFWQMIWEQDVRLVVMATEEKITRETNCMRYWPENLGEEQIYGHYQVLIEDIRDCSPYKIRRMKLRQLTSKQERTIHHLQFTDWPDHKIPDDPTNFLEFVDQMESLRQQSNSSLSHGEEKPPVLVHCTAGVGRTGVIILTDLMIACVQNNQRINIHKTLVHLRRQRMQLVANFGQYRFVYTTVIHYLKNSRLI